MDKFTPKDRDRCWVADPTSISLAGEVTFFKTAMWHEEMLKRGLFFPTRKQAVTAAKEMIDHVPNAQADRPAKAGERGES